VPEIIHCIEYTFYIQDFANKFALALKNSVCPEIFTPLKRLFTFRIFEQLALALKNSVCPEIIHCIENSFHIQDF